VSGWDLGENYWCKNFKLIYRCEDSHLAVQFGQLLNRSRSNVSRDVVLLSRGPSIRHVPACIKTT